MPKSEKTYALQLTRSEIRALDAAGGMFDEIVEEYVRDGELPEGIGEGWDKRDAQAPRARQARQGHRLTFFSIVDCRKREF